jgi:outer membrane protein OmpA-like peptidoglycan-associated protein
MQVPRKLHFLALLISICSMLPQIHAQEASPKKQAIKAYQKAQKLLDAHRSKEAIHQLQSALRSSPHFAEAHLQIADLYRRNRSFHWARQHYEKVLQINPHLSVHTYFGYGESLFALASYEEAESAFLMFQKEMSTPSEQLTRTLRYLNDLTFIRNSTPYSHQVSPLLTTIQPEESHYFPFLHPNGKTLWYTRKFEQKEQLVESQLDEQGNWSLPEVIAPALHIPWFNEGAICFSADGQTMLFTACNRPDGYGSCDLYVAVWKETKWSEPANLGPLINSKAWEAQPSLSADGRTLFFVSNRSGGYGGQDLWQSKLGEDGQWQVPINLGPQINTASDEASPFIHADQVHLYFSSNGHGGMGNHDLYRSRLSKDLTWSKPMNLGAPLNTGASQRGIQVSPEGQMAYYGSEINLENPLYQLMQAKLAPELQPFATQFHHIKALDSLTHQEVKSQSEWQPTDSTLSTFTLTTPYKKGAWPLIKTVDYHVSIIAPGYWPKQTLLAQSNRPDTLQFRLVPFVLHDTLPIEELYFAHDQTDILPQGLPTLYRLHAFLSMNPTILIEIIGHTDPSGSQAYNEILSHKRAQAVAQALVDWGIDRQRLTTSGKGASQPRVSNDSEQGRSINRRTEIVIKRMD